MPTNRFVSTTKKSMKCVVIWIPLKIRVRSRNTQPHLKEFEQQNRGPYSAMSWLKTNFLSIQCENADTPFILLIWCKQTF